MLTWDVNVQTELSFGDTDVHSAEADTSSKFDPLGDVIGVLLT
jgi:hypothetical protein